MASNRKYTGVTRTIPQAPAARNTIFANFFDSVRADSRFEAQLARLEFPPDAVAAILGMRERQRRPSRLREGFARVHERLFAASRFGIPPTLTSTMYEGIRNTMLP